ncbi:hypothetical protein K491DRAFT_591752, partial [Lophiostoma macrostomum CBS 122681]
FGYIAEKMYPSPLRLSSHEVQHRMLRTLFSDEISHHCTLSLIGTCNEFFRGCTTSAQVLYHYTKTLHLVGERLESGEALADSTIAIILMLVLQEQMRHEQLQAEIHYEGLKKMVDLRGGLRGLETNRPLVLKICKIDITFALQFGQPLVYIRDQMHEIKTKLCSEEASQARFASIPPQALPKTFPDLHDVLSDVITLETFINNMPAKQTLDVDTFVEMLISILSRLLQTGSILDTDLSTNTETVWHMGTLIFMMSLFLQHNGQQAINFELVTLRIRVVLDHHLEGVDAGLRLWLMYMSAMWLAEDTDHRKWINSKIRSLNGQLGMESWEAVRRRITVFPWIHRVHDKPAYMVWEFTQHNVP